jgi:hypothetical protein
MDAERQRRAEHLGARGHGGGDVEVHEGAADEVVRRLADEDRATGALSNGAGGVLVERVVAVAGDRDGRLGGEGGGECEGRGEAAGGGGERHPRYSSARRRSLRSTQRATNT